jgi:type II secretory pathway pseudopilin PulG
MTFPTLHRRSPRLQAFTVVELLVAMAVLVTLSLFLVQAVSLMSQAVTINTNKLDSAAQARLFFDRLALDLGARPRRSDLGMVFTKNGTAGNTPGANDTLQFYSVDAYAGARQVSWISYQIVPTSSGTAFIPAYSLERGSNGSLWSGTSSTTLPVSWVGGNPATWVVSAPVPIASNYVLMASGIFRLEFCFLVNNGVTSSYTNGSGNASTSPPTPAVITPTYSNVTALVVGVAVLDSQNLGLLKSLNSTSIGTLSGDFQDTAEGDDPLTDWNKQMAKSSFASGIPAQVVKNIRLYERTFYVP